MTRKKTPVPDSPAADSDRSGLDELTATVDTLAQEVRVLRDAIDDLRDVLDWAMKNREAPASDHSVLPDTRFQGDGLNKDFGEKINRATPDRLPDENEEPSAAVPGELF